MREKHTSRSSRITISAETCALATAADLGIWTQSLLFEVYPSLVPKLRISVADPLPMNTPFSAPSSIAEVHEATIGDESILFVSHAPSMDP